MRSNRRQSLLSAVALATVACAFALPLRGEGASDASTSQPAEQATPAVGPIAYYVAKCARCHGDVSAAYVGLEHPKTGKVLEQEIDDMASGPSQSPLDPEGLKQQTAMHEAMFRKTPFVWIDPNVKDRVAGEVLNGTTLTFETPAGPSAAPTVTENRFELPKQAGTLIAKRGEAVVRIPVR